MSCLVVIWVIVGASLSKAAAHALAIHLLLEDVLVNSSSILSNKDRGRVIEMAVVGSTALLLLIGMPPTCRKWNNNTE